MKSRRNFYVASSIGASLSYIFTILATTGSFNVLHWTVFMAVFLIMTAGFEKLIDYTVEE